MIIKKIALAAAFVALTPSIASAGFLNNWQMDADQDGNFITVPEYLDLVGNSYIENTFTSATNFTFKDNGFFQIAGANGGGTASLHDSNDPVSFGQNLASRQLTAMFTGATGSGTLNGGISFDAGAHLKLYSDVNFDYGTATGIFGANNGTLIADFTLASGSGVVGASAIPNGQITLSFAATFLKTGVFKDSTGTDLATLISLTDPLLFGFVTTNASVVNNPGTVLVSELDQIPGVTVSSPNATNAPTTLLVSNNGQYRFSVPEPTSLALLGLGLLGLGASRKKA